LQVKLCDPCLSAFEALCVKMRYTNRRILYRWYTAQNIAISLSVCPVAYLENRMSKFHQIFYTCCPRPWFDIPLTAMLHVTYVLFVLWMTSCFHIMEQLGQNQRRRVYFVQFARWRQRRGRSLPVSDYRLVTVTYLMRFRRHLCVVVQGAQGDIPNHLTEITFPRRGPPGPPVRRVFLKVEVCI